LSPTAPVLRQTRQNDQEPKHGQRQADGQEPLEQVNDQETGKEDSSAVHGDDQKKQRGKNKTGKDKEKFQSEKANHGLGSVDERKGKSLKFGGDTVDQFRFGLNDIERNFLGLAKQEGKQQKHDDSRTGWTDGRGDFSDSLESVGEKLEKEPAKLKRYSKFPGTEKGDDNVQVLDHGQVGHAEGLDDSSGHQSEKLQLGKVWDTADVVRKIAEQGHHEKCEDGQGDEHLASGRKEDFAEELNSVKNENKESPEILMVWSLALLGGSEKATLDSGRNSGGGQ